MQRVGGMSGIGVDDVKFTKNPKKVGWFVCFLKSVHPRCPVGWKEERSATKGSVHNATITVRNNQSTKEDRTT